MRGRAYEARIRRNRWRMAVVTFVAILNLWFLTSLLLSVFIGVMAEGGLGTGVDVYALEVTRNPVALMNAYDKLREHHRRLRHSGDSDLWRRRIDPVAAANADDRRAIRRAGRGGFGR